MVKIAIVDDHKIFRDGIKFILSELSEFNLVAEYSDGKELIDDIESIDADIILMDIDMPILNGIETTKLAIDIKPDLKIIALSMFGEESYYYKMIHAGVKGFLIKDAKFDELRNAIFDVNSGKNYFSKELLNKVLLNFNTQLSKEEKNNDFFSSTEKSVFKYICEGLLDKEIAEELKKDISDIKNIRNELFKKTNTNDDANLIMYAIKNKIVSI